MSLTEEQRGTAAFDLEKARAMICHYRIENPGDADTDCGLGDLVRQANLAEEFLAEIERLRGFETAARDLNNDLTRIAGERDDLAAQIQEMQAELVRVNQLREIEIDQAGAAERIYLEAARLKDTRIQELEDALVEERVIGEGGFRAGQCEFWYIEDLLEESCMELDGLCDWAKCPRKHELCDVAYQQLAEEGKIGPDAKPHCWQITEERKAAIKELSELLTAIGCTSCHYYIQKNYGENITVLRAMLTEAEQE